MCARRPFQRWQPMHGPEHPNTHRVHHSYARALLAAGRAGKVATAGRPSSVVVRRLAKRPCFGDIEAVQGALCIAQIRREPVGRDCSSGPFLLRAGAALVDGFGAARFQYE